MWTLSALRFHVFIRCQKKKKNVEIYLSCFNTYVCGEKVLPCLHAHFFPTILLPSAPPMHQAGGTSLLYNVWFPWRSGISTCCFVCLVSGRGWAEEVCVICVEMPSDQGHHACLTPFASNHEGK